MQVLEGTWEEIEARKAELVGHRLRVIVEDDEPSEELDPRWKRFIGAVEAPTPTDSSKMEKELWRTPEERARAFQEWAESHRRDIPPLSYEANSRETIYGDRGL